VTEIAVQIVIVIEKDAIKVLAVLAVPPEVVRLRRVVHQEVQEARALVHHVPVLVTKRVKILTANGVDRTVEADLVVDHEKTVIPEEIKTAKEITEIKVLKIGLEIIEIKTKKVTRKKVKIKRMTKLQRRKKKAKKTTLNLQAQQNPKR